MKFWLLQDHALSAYAVAMCLSWAIFPVAPQTTYPSDAAAVNTIFASWGISADDMGWNKTGELCSGTAIDSTAIDDGRYNRLIKCDCSSDNNSTCRITGLKVDGQDVSGPIPDALWSLTYLIHLSLAADSLTGHLSPSVGNLTRLKFLTLDLNKLSGQLPKELGLLTELKILYFRNNDFSGSLPPEMGNLAKLEQLYFYSSGVSGEIPQTFSKLRNLTEFDASDNELNGSIPEFIGSWTNLIRLKFQGNNFQGSIPSSFSNLIAMQDLRLCDIANGDSSLAFIKNMKSLKKLCLRNNNITDTIPADIYQYQDLQLLDLSFNNLYSEIPAFLFFEAQSLRNLYLGSNRLTGSLPAGESTSLLYIDLSYNNLSGGLPKWTVTADMHINLVSNNFSTGGPASSSNFPPDLECLQQDFPCNRGAGKYSDFAVNCGGPRMISSDNVMFETDQTVVKRVTYHAEEKWAMSNVGYFLDGEDNDGRTAFLASLTYPFTNTKDPKLFETARLSAGSLRYYGLGLINGNYNIKLMFAETVMVDNNSGRSLGKRRFDVYIQGNQVLKNFDIRKEAGGEAYRAVYKEFTAEVTKNYIEIHLFWAGKGTCCVPTNNFGPLISAISGSATTDFNPALSVKTQSRNTYMIVGIIVGVAAVLIILASGIYCFRRRDSGDMDNEGAASEVELLETNTRPYAFTYTELRTATEDFSPANKIGEGGFGPVYKGNLNDGSVIAVKQLSVGSHQGSNQFYTEIATISAVQHRNLVKLIGCCMEGTRRMIVYEYLENRSLDQAMFAATRLILNWEKRFNICMGIARGLTYLHEESRIRIVHRDVKVSNILLDAELNPKISDFGLAKLYDGKMTHISTGVAGTIGYLAPEYAMRGHLTEKADVFSYGVLSLEIVSGRPNTATDLESENVYLMEWVWELHQSNRVLDLVDPRLSEFDAEQVRRIIKIALLCTQTSPAMRPAMSTVVAMLSGHIEVNPVLSKPTYLTDWKFNDSSNPASGISINDEDGQTASYNRPVGTSVDQRQPVPKGRNTY